MSNNISDAFAVVYAADGSRHKVCRTSGEAAAAENELVAAGLTPVVFRRSGTDQASVVNIAHGGFSGIQAGNIQGGVWNR